MYLFTGGNVQKDKEIILFYLSEAVSISHRAISIKKVLFLSFSQL